MNDHQKTFLICGAGQFGSRASYYLAQDPKNNLTIIDHDPEKLNQIRELSVKKIQADVIDYLTRQQSSLKPDSIIIPAVPFHLAFKWLMAMIQKDYIFHRLDISPEILSKLPHPGHSSDREIICSYADFICPADCIEPEDFCTITGRKRGTPLFELIAGIKSDELQTEVIRSRQIGPGIGGYCLGELLALKERIVQGKTGKWLIGTACRCHGILSAFEIVK